MYNVNSLVFLSDHSDQTVAYKMSYNLARQYIIDSVHLIRVHCDTLPTTASPRGSSAQINSPSIVVVRCRSHRLTGQMIREGARYFCARLAALSGIEARTVAEPNRQQPNVVNVRNRNAECLVAVKAPSRLLNAQTFSQTRSVNYQICLCHQESVYCWSL